MKQTAVEFLHSEYKRILGDALVDFQKVFAISDSFAKAKEMEKQQPGYSDEEVEIIAKDAYAMGRKGLLVGVFNKWFEQFKKK